MMSRRRLVGGDLVGGRYRVRGRLGGGGPAGEVYAARDTALGLDVALKIHRSEGLWSAPARRFWRGAVLSQEVSHPNVCAIHDLGAEWDRPVPFLFATMDLVAGETLRARLRRTGALAIAEVRALGRQLAAGLAAIHRARIVHRDIKSDNIVLEGDRAVIVDFGLAREAEPVPEDVTMPGVLCGTPAYMAPEQALGQAATEASDVYALGAVLYEMVTGVTPYATDSSNQVILLKQTAEPFPDPRERRPDVPPELDALIRRCLAAHPARRCRAAELARELGLPPALTTSMRRAAS
jgi:serine/threonine protein kinase